MIFLIEYDQHGGTTISIRRYNGAQLHEAEKDRLELELALNRQAIDHEVVILEAEDEPALRRTHQRYFSGLREMIEEFKSSLDRHPHPSSAAD